VDRDDEFAAFVAARGVSLRRSAFLMTGNWHDAEDLVQTALAKLYVAWPRVRIDGAEAYARTIIARTHVDARRRFWHREQPSE
jgi:DNA-directed RNA polymerase specialized sigma24 family protein